MRILLPVFIPFFISFTLPAQTLKKYSVGKSGCSVYMLCNPGEFDVSYSEDSSAVYTAECSPDSVTFGIICVKLKESVAAGQGSEEMMISYLDYLKTAFNIKSSAGYGKGQIMEKKPEVKGVIDYWTDDTGDEWKIKGWTDGKFIAVLFVYEKGKLEYSGRHDVFLNGFRFPGM